MEMEVARNKRPAAFLQILCKVFHFKRGSGEMLYSKGVRVPVGRITTLLSFDLACKASREESRT